jgi:hypothetical protein
VNFVFSLPVLREYTCTYASIISRKRFGNDSNGTYRVMKKLEWHISKSYLSNGIFFKVLPPTHITLRSYGCIYPYERRVILVGGSIKVAMV